MNKDISVQNSTHFSLVWLGDLYKHEKITFLSTTISVTRHSFKVHMSSLFMIRRCSLLIAQTNTSPFCCLDDPPSEDCDLQFSFFHLY